MISCVDIYNIMQKFSPYIVVISLFIDITALIFSIFIYIQAKKISQRFLNKGVYRTPSFGIEVLQNDKKLRITGINEEGKSSNKIKAKRKPFLFCIPKKVFDFYKIPESQRVLYLKVFKISKDYDIKGLKDSDIKELFMSVTGSADYPFASNVMFMGKETFMVFDKYRMIEREDYFFHLYFNTFMHSKLPVHEMRTLEKGSYLFIFMIKSGQGSAETIFKELLEINFT